MGVPKPLPGLIVSTDVSGNDSLRMMIPLYSMNQNYPVAQSQTIIAADAPGNIPVFMTDRGLTTPYRQQQFPLYCQVLAQGGLESAPSHAAALNAPRKAKRSFEDDSDQGVSSVSMTEVESATHHMQTVEITMHDKNVTNPLEASKSRKNKGSAYKKAQTSSGRNWCSDTVDETSKILLKSDRSVTKETACKFPPTTGRNTPDRVIPALTAGPMPKDPENVDPSPKRSLAFSSKDMDASDPFILDDDCTESLKRFILCSDGLPWNEPSKFRELKASDDPTVYQIHKKSHENRPPKIFGVLTHIIPTIVRRKSCQTHIRTANFNESHREIISKLFALIHCSGSKWEGIFLLLPWTNMSFTRYCLETAKPLHPSLFLIEAHRRVMKMEGACSELINYLAATIKGSQKLLRRIAPKHLADAYAVLVSGFDLGAKSGDVQVEGSSASSGISPPSGDSVSTMESNAHIALCIIKIVPAVSSGISTIAGQCKWLKDNRR
jgi:hypothetical protein